MSYKVYGEEFCEFVGSVRHRLVRAQFIRIFVHNLISPLGQEHTGQCYASTVTHRSNDNSRLEL